MKALLITTNFTDYARRTAAAITPVLQRALGEWEETVAAQSGGQLAGITSLLAAGAGGGKLLRGTLVVLGHELAGGKTGPAIYQAAAAYELIHAGFLIQDDIMDRSPLRRGRSAAHLAAGGGHHGLSQAICLSDAAIFLSHQLLAEAGFSPEQTVAALAKFSQIALATAAGQMLDLQLSPVGAARTEADVLRMYGLKTAAYTITGPLGLGALLAAAPAARLAAIERYGAPVGTAFQLQDDILGVFGDPNATGKSATSDIEQNKSTVLIAYAQSHATPAQRGILAHLYGRASLSTAEIAAVKSIFTASGALAHTQNLAARHVDQGLAAAAAVTPDSDFQLLLTGLARYSVERTI